MTDRPDTSASTVRSWLAKAGDDLAIAELVLNSEISVEWAACFHAGLLPASSDVGFDIDALTDLAPWAVAGRYPEDIENPTEIGAYRLVGLAQAAVHHAHEQTASD